MTPEKPGVNGWPVRPKEAGADAVLFALMKFCDTDEYDLPWVRCAAQEADLPFLHLELEQTMQSAEPLRTRLQAFCRTTYAHLLDGRGGGCMEAHYIGIDIGSTATKLAALSGERALLGTTVVPFGTGTQADQLALETFYRNSRLSPSDCVRTIATGYGRLIFRGADAQVSEISCHAKGLPLSPQARTIIDVGGQDLRPYRSMSRAACNSS